MGKNATSFQPGQSGNPNGQPLRELSFKGALKKALEQKRNVTTTEGYQAEVERLQEVAENLIEVATQKVTAFTGRDIVSAAKEIADRVDGKVTQKIAGDEDESPVTIVIKKYNDAKPEGDDGGD